MWIEVGNREELARARKTVVEAGGRQIVVFWHDDQPRALDNICIHRQRELVKGVILNGRIVCPGHQWAYDLATGYCKERDRCQPVHAVRVEDDTIFVESEPTTVELAEEVAWPRSSS